MYTAYLEDELLLDPSNNLLIDEPTVELADNSAGSFSFTITYDHPLYDKIANFKIVSVFQEDELIFKGRIIRFGKGDLTKSVECEGELAYLDDSIQRPAEYHDISVRGFLETVLNNHNERVESSKWFYTGAVTVTDPNDSLYRYTNNESSLTVLKDKLVERLGGHLRVRYQDGKRYLDYLADYPRVCEQKIEFGENLLRYAEDTSAYDLATVCVPQGAALDENSISALQEYLSIKEVNNGKDYLEIPEAVSRYGRIEKVVSFEDVHVASNLKAKGEAWLRDNQYEDLSLELDAVDLGDLGLASDHLRLLDRVRCSSKPHGMDREFPLTSMTIHLLDPEQNTYTLGSKIKTFSSSTSRAQAEYQQFQKDTPTHNALVEQARKNAEALLNAFAMSGYVYITENEIYILDIPCNGPDDLEKAKNVWRWNMGGLAFSSSGYKGPYVAAMTMDGTIMGNLLAAGTVAADKIDIGYTQAQEKKWQDKLGNEYWTSSITQTQIKNSADSVLISAQEWVGKNYYTQAQIDVKTNAIDFEVSKKVGSSSIISAINMSPESIKISSDKFSINASDIRLQSTTLSWSSTYSSMTSNGTLSCSNATVKGTFKCGTDSGYWVELQSTGRMAGGRSTTQYGFIDYSADVVEVDTGINRRGVQIQGGCLRISTNTISVRNTSDTSQTTYRGVTGSYRTIYTTVSGTWDLSSCKSATVEFINGICVSIPAS